MTYLPRFVFGSREVRGADATLRKARSNEALSSPSALSSCASSTKRRYCAGSSGLGFGLRGMEETIAPRD
jgi:hypothetical protein